VGLRQEKLARQIQRDLVEIFMHHKEWVGGQFVTISGVQISPDLSLAKVYLSLFNAQQRKTVLENIELFHREIRKELARKVKNQVKKVPDLRFYEDESQDYANKMEQIFENLKKQEEDNKKNTD
jgi:ribosome-binding factor A